MGPGAGRAAAGLRADRREQREGFYPVSPAAAELRPVLEDPGNGWKGFGCERSASATTTRVAGCRGRCATPRPATIAPLLRVSPVDVATSGGRSLIALAFADVFYSALDPASVNSIDPAERAVLGQAIVGVPATNIAAVAVTTEYQRTAWVQIALGWLYRILFVGLAVLTLAGAVLAVRWRRERRANGPLIVLALALGTGVLVRLVLFAVVDTIQFGIEARYHQATWTFLLTLLAVGAVACVALIRAHRAAHCRTGGSAGPVDQDSAQERMAPARP